MKIVFLIQRMPCYRHFVPLVQEGLRRGHVLECWHDSSITRGGQRWYSYPDLDYSPKFSGIIQPVFRSFNGKAELERELSLSRDIQAIISLHPSSYDTNEKIIKSSNFTWVYLMQNADSFFILPKNPRPLELKNRKDLFAVFSDKWVQLGREYLQLFYPQYSYLLDDEHMDFVTVGNPEFDIFKEIDVRQVRSKYGIPKDKDILIYLPFPYNNRSEKSGWETAYCGLLTNTKVSSDGMFLHDQKKNLKEYYFQKAYYFSRLLKDPSAFRYWITGVNEGRVFDAVRRFCKKNNLFLVVKPRLKFPIAEPVKKKADLVIWDTEREQNPPVLKELLSIAKLTVSHYSFSVLLSAYAKVFHLNVASPGEMFINAAHKFWFSTQAPSFFDFPGICESWKAEEVIKKLGNMPLEHFRVDALKREKYVKEYFTYDDYNSSKRLFEALEKRISHEENVKQQSSGSIVRSS